MRHVNSRGRRRCVLRRAHPGRHLLARAAARSLPEECNYNPDALPSSEVVAKATLAKRLVFGGITPKIERGE